jgi:Cd2+/Zn2+-exporting ATPase
MADRESMGINKVEGKSCSCGNGHRHENEHSNEHSHSGSERGDSCGCGHEHTGGFKKHHVRLWVGVAIFGVSILLTNLLPLPNWAVLLLFLAAYVVLGANVIAAAAKNISKGKVFDENFLMTVATVGAFVLGDYVEGTAVMLFYLIGETLSDMAVEKSKRSITELMDIRPDYANVEREGSLQKTDPETVAVGEVIVIKPYEKTPLDSVVLEGYSSFNTSALTGESVPLDAGPGSKILSGSVNGGNLIKARVEKPYGESAAAKILDIVEHAGSRKSTTEKFITKFARYYTPIVCAGALAVALIPRLYG